MKTPDVARALSGAVNPAPEAPARGGPNTHAVRATKAFFAN
ncbi:MAG TPA: hypothetical protein VLJ17_19985 [Xanthobacteraceae bacterium]|nr:hypothetical protein [Xanthobacteraceae bacterium]